MTDEQKAELNAVLDATCRPLDEALRLAFDEVYDGDEGYLKARCCGGECCYKSGIFGSDFAECPRCGSEIRMILSPHVSPLLLGNGHTTVPSNEFIDFVGDRLWWVSKLHDAARREASSDQTEHATRRM